MPSFGGEVKLEVPCKILWHLGSMNKNNLARLNSSFPSPIPPACYQMTTGRIARELWQTNQEFSSVDIPPWFSILIYHVGDEQ
jgi:hypothetical protein